MCKTSSIKEEWRKDPQGTVDQGLQSEADGWNGQQGSAPQQSLRGQGHQLAGLAGPGLALILNSRWRQPREPRERQALTWQAFICIFLLQDDNSFLESRINIALSVYQDCHSGNPSRRLVSFGQLWGVHDHCQWKMEHKPIIFTFSFSWLEMLF